MSKSNSNSDGSGGTLSAQVFVLRVPAGSAAALVEHVNDGAISRHGTIQDAFLRIETLLSPPTPRTIADRRH
ncbi:hypothetical protein [Flavimaricola marinus]|uniref:Uncharacterized protein n=1 Tax=Flavimaricola marinus TaxID=1819565 RepID=A0A238LA26_9RHOB|nr:hypothetical protein [Flavimaricola marinus]SMY06274.1 hypothetical protein LOM8899_00397 [Flavimaricola marinus]